MTIRNMSNSNRNFVILVHLLLGLVTQLIVLSEASVVNIPTVDIPNVGDILDSALNRTRSVDLASHPGEECTRECVEGETRVCYYKFVLEHYHAMGPACGDCARGVEEDCYAPQCIIGDGTEKGVMSINRKVPGPDIQVCKNDLIVVDVQNHAHGTAAAIHWHGIHMRDTPHMDGVPYVTQCPIPFATTFRYSFWATEAGTQFYHSHSGHHKINGQYGALIVRDPPGVDPNSHLYDFDLPEHHILISDWMHQYGENLFPGLPSSGGIFPDSVLINGRGIYINPRTLEHTDPPVTKYFVEPGKRYRFRFINSISHACPFQMQIEGHTLEVIASDSYNVQPKPFDTLVTNSGERYDFVLEANHTAGDFWIRVRGLGVCATNPTESFALIRYVSPNDVDADADANRALPPIPRWTESYPAGIYLNHPNATCFGGENDHCISELVAHDRDDGLRYAVPDHQFFLAFKNYPVSNAKLFRPNEYHHFSNLASNLTIVGAINNLSLVFPSYPPLTQPEDIDDSQFCDSDSRPAECADFQLCPCVHRIKVETNSLVELVIVDESTVVGRMHHPFHLHGYRFMVLGMGQHPTGIPMTVPLARDLERRRALPRDYFNESPPFKDTISIPSRGYAVVRFWAENPGFWLMHCHYEWHLAIGMGLIVQVGEPSEMVAPPARFPKCGNYIPDIRQSSS